MAYLATPKIVDLLFFGHGESTTAIKLLPAESAVLKPALTDFHA